MDMTLPVAQETGEPVTLAINEIVSNPKVKRGRPTLRGTGILVQTIVNSQRNEGFSPEVIAEHFRITPAQAYAALAYYHLHRDELEASWDEEERQAEENFAALEKMGRAVRFERD